MSDIQDPKLLWVSISILIAILGFFIRSWVLSVKEDSKEIKGMLTCKQDKTICQERYPDIKRDLGNFYAHVHPVNCEKDETGKVVIP